MFIYLVHMKQKMTTIKNYSIKKIRESYGINILLLEVKLVCRILKSGHCLLEKGALK